MGSVAFIVSFTVGLRDLSFLIAFTAMDCMPNRVELMNPAKRRGGRTPLYNPKNPSFDMVCRKQSHAPVNRPPFPSVCSLTLIVSKAEGEQVSQIANALPDPRPALNESYRAC